MGFGDAEIRKQQRRGLGFHRSAVISMQSELAGLHPVLFDSVVEQRLKQRGGFRVGDVPAALDSPCDPTQNIEADRMFD